MVIKILDSRSKVMRDLKRYNLPETIKRKHARSRLLGWVVESIADLLALLELMEIMKFAIEYDDLELTVDVMAGIGEVYVMFGDLKSAINAYNCIVKRKKDELIGWWVEG